MYSKYFLTALKLFCGAIFCFFSCTNAKKVVKQTQAFSAISYPGIVAVDENGKEMPSKAHTKYLVYVVTASENIAFDTAWINGNAFTIVAEKMNALSGFDVGISKQTGDKITIQTKENEHLYRLQLTPVSENDFNVSPLQEKELRIKAVYKRKEVILHTSKITELTTPDPV